MWKMSIHPFQSVMSKIAYLDCPTGIAGDMCLGALVDLGVPLAYLTERLDRLGISEEYQLKAETVQRNGQRATKVHVMLKSEQHHSHHHEHEHSHHQNQHHHSDHHHDHHSHHHEHEHSHHHEHHHAHDHNELRNLPDIEKMIKGANLPPRAEAWSLAVFRQLAVSEGAVHGIPPEAVHFHEVGAIDAIVDIVGTCLGLDWLDVDRIVCSALPTGGGTVWASHGRLPVPVPAVLKLFEMGNVPIYSNGIEKELVTPTGAAIAVTLADEFGAAPRMRVKQIGLGAGSINLQIPNMIRIWIGEVEHREAFQSIAVSPAKNSKSGRLDSTPEQETNTEMITVLETQVDDLNPQAIGYLFEQLLEAGALDVFTQAIGMKKSRPGLLLTVICAPEQVERCETIVFQETTTLGIRRTVQQRTALDRRFDPVQTELGTVQVKVASRHGAIVNVQPEYEDCAKLAKATQLPWREVHRIALQAWYMAQTENLS